MTANDSSGERFRSIVALVRARRTIHAFAPRVPPHALVLEALDAARCAPNHYRTRPWRFSLLGARTIARVIELSTELVRAKDGELAAEHKRARWDAIPGWLVVTCQRSDDARREREDYAACCCVIQNFALALWAAGVGSKWSTGEVTRDPRFMAAVGADAEREFCVGLVWYGYPAKIPTQSQSPLASVLRDVE